MEIICVDAAFPPDALLFYRRNNVATPGQDGIYTIREVLKTVTGKTGILLNELINPDVTFPHPVLGIARKEVSWDLNRFRTLNGGEITRELVQEIMKEKTKTKQTIEQAN